MTVDVPNFLPALPEIWVFSMACVILVMDLFLSKQTRLATYILSQATLVGAIVLTLQGMSTSMGPTFHDMFIHDTLSDLLKLATYLIIFFVFVYSREYLQARDMYRGEYFVLGLFGVVGMMIMASARHFLTLYLGLELLSLSLYAMVAFQRDSVPATEAAMKYFVLGALSSGMLLYGMSILYGLTGSLDIAVVKDAITRISADDVVLIFGMVFVLVGIAFKIGAVAVISAVHGLFHRGCRRD